MSRTAALQPEQVQPDSKPTLDAFTKHIGFTPNMMATVAQSPIAFNAWANLLGSLSKALDVKTRDSIGPAVSEVNGCNYCLTFAALWPSIWQSYWPLKSFSPGRAMPQTRSGTPPSKVIETRGQVTDVDLRTDRAAGYTEANVMEIARWW